MTAKTQNSALDRAEVVSALAHFRCAWEEAAGDQSLIDIEVSLGMLLADVAISLHLSGDELKAVLGERLKADFIQTVRTR